MKAALRRWVLALLPVGAAALAPAVILSSARSERENVDRVVARDLALHRAHYAEPDGVPISALRSQADGVSTSILAGYRAFLDQKGLKLAPECRVPEASTLPALAFKDALIRFRERNAARMATVAVTGSFNTSSFSDLRPEVLEEYLVQASAAESLLTIVEGMPLESMTVRVASNRVRRAKPADVFDRAIQVSIRVEFHACASALDDLLDALAGDASPFVVERLSVENAFQADPSKRTPDLRCSLDLLALWAELLAAPRYTDQRPIWVRDVEGL